MWRREMQLNRESIWAGTLAPTAAIPNSRSVLRGGADCSIKRGRDGMTYYKDAARAMIWRFMGYGDQPPVNAADLDRMRMRMAESIGLQLKAAFDDRATERRKLAAMILSGTCADVDAALKMADALLEKA